MNAAAFSDAVVVYANLTGANAFTGHLTISGSDNDDTMYFGSGGTTVHATLGDDTYWFGSGADTISYTSADQSDGTLSNDTIALFDSASDAIDLSFFGIDGSDVVVTDDGTDTTISIDTTGDTVADMQITLLGVALAETDINFDYTP
jgi:Ca2+-binding RTX toxin-like protein